MVSLRRPRNIRDPGVTSGTHEDRGSTQERDGSGRDRDQPPYPRSQRGGGMEGAGGGRLNSTAGRGKACYYFHLVIFTYCVVLFLTHSTKFSLPPPPSFLVSSHSPPLPHLSPLHRRRQQQHRHPPQPFSPTRHLLCRR